MEPLLLSFYLKCQFILSLVYLLFVCMHGASYSAKLSHFFPSVESDHASVCVFLCVLWWLSQTKGYYPGPAPVQQQQPGVVVVTQPTVVMGGAFTVGDSPMQVSCPNCRNTIVTAVSYEVGLLCWIIVGVLFIIG